MFNEYLPHLTVFIFFPGLFESASMNFVNRKILQHGLWIMLSSAFMTFLSTGFHLSNFIAFLALFVIRRQITKLSVLCYLLTAALGFFDLQPHLMPQILWVHYFKVTITMFTYVILTYESLKKSRPQILWPPLLSASYGVSPEMTVWSTCHVISCLNLSWKSNVNKLKTFLGSFITISVIALAFYTNQNSIRGNGVFEDNLDLLPWTDYRDICINENPWLQRPEKQLQCAKFINSKILWSGEISGIRLKPKFIWTEIYQFFHYITNTKQVQILMPEIGQNNIFGAFWLDCYLKINMIEGRSIMGSRHFQTITAYLNNANICLNLNLNNEIEVNGYVASVDYDTDSHLYIQKLTKK